MGEPIPPKPVRLSLGRFPKEPWAKDLVDAFNQLALQTTQALTMTAPALKTLKFTTGATVADSFPIDVPVTSPPSTWSAMVLSGVPSGAVTVQAAPLSGGKLLRVSLITGLAADTAYSIRLVLE